MLSDLKYSQISDQVISVITLFNLEIKGDRINIQGDTDICKKYFISKFL